MNTATGDDVMKYASLLLGLAILMPSVMTAAAEPYNCGNAVDVIDFRQEPNGKIQSYTVTIKPSRYRVRDVVHVGYNKSGARFVRVNGKRCEIPE